MTNMLSEINRVREIMGVNVIYEQSNEEQVIDIDNVVPSPEITEWAKSEISWRQKVIDRGVEEDGYTQDELDEYAAEILELQQDPVRVLQEDKDRYCKWVEEGDNDWVDECQETTELLATLSSEDSTTGTTVTQMPITRDPFSNTGSTGTIAGEGPRGDKKKKKEKKKKEKKEKEPTPKQMAKELKTAWKKEVFKVLDSVNSGDVFGFKEVYSLQKNDKLHALLKMLQNIMCINAKIAKITILIQDKVYDSTKLMDTAIMPVGEGHEGLINTIENNMEIIDDSFKLFRGGMKVDKKLRPIRKQLDQARATINELTQYVNWSETFDILGFDARSTEDIFLNSENLRRTHKDCANQLGTL